MQDCLLKNNNMILFYNFILRVIKPFYILFSLTIPKINEFEKKRKISLDQLQSKFLNKNKVIWLHASSVGELDQCKSIAKVIKKNLPDINLIQSVYSNSVKEKNLLFELYLGVFYLPVDFPNSYDLIFEKYHPEILIITAWDIWPNLIQSGRKFGCDIFLACGSLHEKSSRLKNPFFHKLTAEVLNLFTGISPAGRSSEELFKKLVNKNIDILSCGDSRFDSVCEKIEFKNNENEIFKSYKSTNKVIILASTYKICDDILFPCMNNLVREGYHFWIFPHKIDNKRIDEIKASLTKLNLKFQLYSNTLSLESDVLVFDILGLLAFAYEKAHICYVGGGFHNRIHNVIEPAYFGLPVSTGENIQHAPEAIELNHLGYLNILRSSEDFYNFCISNHDSIEYEIKKENIKKYVQDNRGASERFFNHFLRKRLL